ncbi:hypothetical protein ACSN7O_004714 [Enterobacter chuandaensis]
MSEPIRELSEPELSQVGGGGLLKDLVGDVRSLVGGVLDEAVTMKWRKADSTSKENIDRA